MGDGAAFPAVEDQMKCVEHSADGCAECQPGMRAVWTVGQFKAALAAIPDDRPLAVRAVDTSDPDFADEQVIVGTGFGTVGWGDGYGPETGAPFLAWSEGFPGTCCAPGPRPWRRAGA